MMDHPPSSIIFGALTLEKELFWQANKGLSPDQIQQQWAIRNAHLSSILGPTAPTQGYHLTSETFSSPGSQPVALLPPALLEGSSDLSTIESAVHPNNPDQLVLPLMARKRSNQSEHGPSSIENWQSDGNEPFNQYSMSMGRASKAQRIGSRTYTPNTFGDPENFLSICETAQPYLSPVTPLLPRSQRSSNRLSQSPRQDKTYNPSLSQSPSTSTTSELTNPTTFAMSHQSSQAGSSLCRAVEMMKMNSQTSVFSNFSTNADDSSYDTSPSSINQSNVSMLDVDRSHYVGHAGGIVDDTPSHSYVTLPSPESFLSSPMIAEDTCMHRSSSTETNASNQSRASSRRSLKDVVQSARPIAPKLDSGESLSRESSSSGHQLIRIGSDDGSSKVFGVLPKANYVRPIHEKVKCRSCNEHPSGFRGEHELRRHVERKHSVTRKVWVCTDISSDQKFLASCKACSTGKKYYAYYNAAAHLRRAHFHPKGKGRKGKIEPELKRGAKSGGDDPPMEVVKMWMTEKEEFGPPQLKDEGILDGAGNERINEVIEDYFHQPCNEFESSSASTANLDIPNPFGNVPAQYSPSQPRYYENTSFQLTTPTANTADVFDLSRETSINDTLVNDASINVDTRITDTSEMIFNMDIPPENPFYLF